MNKQILFTKSGFEKIKQENEELLKSRPFAVADLKRAREMGDLSENGFYKGARLKLSQIDSKLRHLKMLLRYGVIKDSKKTDTIDIGCNVTVLFGKEKQFFIIVGGFESNPEENKISYISPIGKALMGKKINESFIVTIPSGIIEVKVIKISL